MKAFPERSFFKAAPYSGRISFTAIKARQTTAAIEGVGAFTKTLDELDTDLDKWLYILKNMSIIDKIPGILRESIFQKLFTIAEVFNRIFSKIMISRLKKKMRKGDAEGLTRPHKKRQEPIKRPQKLFVIRRWP